MYTRIAQLSLAETSIPDRVGGNKSEKKQIYHYMYHESIIYIVIYYITRPSIDLSTNGICQYPLYLVCAVDLSKLKGLREHVDKPMDHWVL